MTVLITMAGLGSRFKNAGYKTEKYKIVSNGYSLFEWSLKTIKDLNKHNLILVTLGSYDNRWIEEKSREIGFTNLKIINLDKLTKGQAETAYIAMIEAREYFDENYIYIYNIDTYIDLQINESIIKNYDGCIYTFKSEEENLSYVKIDEKNNIKEVAEKKVISDNASIGLYVFKELEQYTNAYEATFRNENNLVNNEKYIMPIYNYIIQKGGSLLNIEITPEKVHILGTPEHLKKFEALNIKEEN